MHKHLYENRRKKREIDIIIRNPIGHNWIEDHNTKWSAIPIVSNSFFAQSCLWLLMIWTSNHTPRKHINPNRVACSPKACTQFLVKVDGINLTMCPSFPKSLLLSTFSEPVVVQAYCLLHVHHFPCLGSSETRNLVLP